MSNYKITAFMDLSKPPRYFSTFAAFGIAIISAFQIGATQAQAQGYYAERPLFHPNPPPGGPKPWNVKNLGPVGIGIDLKAPRFTMVISNVEKGSPAQKSGKLKVGQVIESINGQVLKDRDPRIILGDIVTQAEATDGKVRFKIKGQGEVVVTIPVMGRYSPTWPLNCPKSDNIVRKFADLLAKKKNPSWGAVIFMLSTGEEKDLAVVRRWMKDFKDAGAINWQRGYSGPGICEYYLRTGDASVLPGIRASVKELEKHMYNGGWAGRAGPASFTYSTGTGQLHAAGVHCFTFLAMARLCGVEVDEYTFQETLKQFYRYAGKGNVAYGDGVPEGGYTDNGKHSGLAVAMSATAMLSKEGESSVYAKARDNSAMKAFYATNWFHSAHTGGGIGEIWHHSAMSLMREKRPVQYRSYLDTRRWVMDLARRFDGSIGIAGVTDRYDVSATEDVIDFGTFFALTYTLPRKHLQLYGAPRSKWAKYDSGLPERPWGNLADDAFLLNDPAGLESLTMKMILQEKVPTDSSYPVFNRLNAPGKGDDVLIKYFHHPEIGLRNYAMKIAVARGKIKYIVPLLKSHDPRLRHLGVLSIRGMFKGTPIPVEKITPEMVKLLGQIIEDHKASWWVVQDAIFALGRCGKPAIAKHRDRLLYLLENRDSKWTKVAALGTLAKISAEPAHYKVLLPRLLDNATQVWNNNAWYQFSRELGTALKSARPEVKAFAAPLMEKAYRSIPPKLVAKSGAVLSNGSETMKGRLSTAMQTLPGANKFIRYLPKKTLASTRSGKSEDMFVYEKFELDPRFVGKWLQCTKHYGGEPTDQQLESKAKSTFAKYEQTKNKKGRGKGRLSYMVLNENGSGNRFWSRNMIIWNIEAEARQMKLRTVKGKQYLLLELGIFPERSGKDWHPGYMVYLKQ